MAAARPPGRGLRRRRRARSTRWRPSAPFFEPGLRGAARARARQRRRLPSPHDLDRPRGPPTSCFVVRRHAAAQGRAAPPTPRYVVAAVDGARAAALARPALIVGKSTVPVGTAAAARRARSPRPRRDLELAWNPEFLREGHAVDDTLHPDRLVFGVPSSDAGPRRCCGEVYASPIDAGTPGRRHRPRHRRAGQGGRELVPRHQDLLHQRDGRGVRGGRRRRRDPRRRHRPRRPHRPQVPQRRPRASAAAACPRTSARSWPGPASSAPTRR